MKTNHLATSILLLLTLTFASDVDSMNLKSMYEGAAEVEMLNKSMEAGMREHNQQVQPILTETTEHIIDNTPIASFQELENKYYLEKQIEDSKNTKVEVSVNANVIKITSTTTKKEHTLKDNGLAESVYSSSTVEELPIPSNANMQKMKKEYKDGVLIISIPKE
jgi:HSP20 family molecular chaperone IbpA